MRAFVSASGLVISLASKRGLTVTAEVYASGLPQDLRTTRFQASELFSSVARAGSRRLAHGTKALWPTADETSAKAADKFHGAEMPG